jgi:PmbA protein
MRTDEDFARRLLARAREETGGLAEVYQRASRTLSVDVKGGEVEALETSVGFGYALRVIRDGHVGFSYATDKDALEAVRANALETMKGTEKDEFAGLPGPEAARSLDVYDPAVASISEEEAIRGALDVERAALGADRRMKKVRRAQASFGQSETLVMNTRGVSVSYPSTLVGSSIMAVAEEGQESQMGWGFQVNRFLRGVSFPGVGAEAARRALCMLGARRISPVKAPVLLDGQVAAEFLSVFASMLSADAVQKGKSLLAGKVGQRVMSENVDIVDDGLRPREPGSRPIDDEGVPVGRNELVSRGVLRGYMHNTRTAAKDGVRSTGNGMRGGFQALPTVGPVSMYLDAPGEKPTLETLLGGMQRGLYIVEAMGVHTINPISGHFSIGVSGLWVEGGKVLYPVKEAAVSGNLLEFFGKAEALAGDLRFYGSIGSPSLLVGPTDISA